jgi:hypothetical protein
MITSWRDNVATSCANVALDVTSPVPGSAATMRSLSWPRERSRPEASASELSSRNDRSP